MPSGPWLWAYIVLWIVVLGEGALLVAFLRHVRVLYAHWVTSDPEVGLPLGALAPAIEATDLYGRQVALAGGRSRQSLIYFVSTGCGGCKSVMHRLPGLCNQPAAELVLIVNSRSSAAKLYMAEHWRGEPLPPFTVVADDGKRLADQYNVNQVPFAVVVDLDGRIGAKGHGFTYSEAASLIAQAEELQRQRSRSDGRSGDARAAEVGSVVTA